MPRWQPCSVHTVALPVFRTGIHLGLDPEALIVMGREDFIVRSLRMGTGQEMWNATFGRIVQLPMGGASGVGFPLGAAPDPSVPGSRGAGGLPDGSTASAPDLANTARLTVTADNTLHAYDPTTGYRRWALSFDVPPVSAYSSFAGATVGQTSVMNHLDPSAALPWPGAMHGVPKAGGRSPMAVPASTGRVQGPTKSSTVAGAVATTSGASKVLVGMMGGGLYALPADHLVADSRSGASSDGAVSGCLQLWCGTVASQSQWSPCSCPSVLGMQWCGTCDLADAPNSKRWHVVVMVAWMLGSFGLQVAVWDADSACAGTSSSGLVLAGDQSMMGCPLDGAAVEESIHHAPTTALAVAGQAEVLRSLAGKDNMSIAAPGLERPLVCPLGVHRVRELNGTGGTWQAPSWLPMRAKTVHALPAQGRGDDAAGDQGMGVVQVAVSGVVVVVGCAAAFLLYAHAKVRLGSPQDPPTTQAQTPATPERQPAAGKTSQAVNGSGGYGKGASKAARRSASVAVGKKIAGNDSGPGADCVGGEQAGAGTAHSSETSCSEVSAILDAAQHAKQMSLSGDRVGSNNSRGRQNSMMTDAETTTTSSEIFDTLSPLPGSTGAGGMGGDIGGGQSQHRTASMQPDGSLLLGRLRVGPGVIGYGSAGTVVFEGSMDGRPVAVKRLLRQFYDLARKELEVLIVSDEVGPRGRETGNV